MAKEEVEPASAKKQLETMFKNGYTPAKRFHEKCYMAAFSALQMHFVHLISAHRPRDGSDYSRAIIGLMLG
jgi:hypothetical protein